MAKLLQFKQNRKAAKEVLEGKHVSFSLQNCNTNAKYHIQTQDTNIFSLVKWRMLQIDPTPK